MASDATTDTAVDHFVRAHQSLTRPLHSLMQVHQYRAPIPLERPEPGQQYAFEVDLDACTGCKACVTGCHSLNGLDDGELWRTVGLLHGGSALEPVQQTLTTSCHHCLEPACMIGCPVGAYEKDPLTGIVKHLDDQCIGCQYCLFTCPYDAPKFNPARGIVRKCDMCSERLANRESPACVASCPNEAIRITIVEQAHAIEAAEGSAFVPGAAAPSQTLPTTQYRKQRALPANLLPRDFYAVDREKAHPPLVAMLVLSQLSVGAFGFDVLMRSHKNIWALAFGLLAMAASLLHLGRPLHAWRAVIGLRTSWLSREVLGFGAFIGLALLDLAWDKCEPATAAVGLLAVACSVMVYAVTAREGWRLGATAFRFFGTTVILGAAAISPELFPWVVGASAAKLAWEASLLLHSKSRRQTAAKRTAILLTGDLGRVTFARFFFGITGGVILTLLGAPQLAVLVCCLIGELCERWLFFAATPAPKMPGVGG